MEISEKLAGGEDGGSPFSGFPRKYVPPDRTWRAIIRYDDGEGGGGRVVGGGSTKQAADDIRIGTIIRA